MDNLVGMGNNNITFKGNNDMHAINPCVYNP
jgi:hypothetical protein